jgi:hypothetical protein
MVLKIGKLSTDKWYSNHYTVELEGKKYHVAFRNNPLAELVVFRKNINEPLLTCGLVINSSEPSVNFNPEDNNEISSLLLALCWYIFLPVAKDTLMQHV